MQRNPEEVQVVVLSQSTPTTRQTVINNNAQPGLMKQILIFGVMQIVFGSLSFVAHCVGIGIQVYGQDTVWPYFDGHGIWCGAVFIITGPIGITAKRKNKKNLVMAFNFMSIISACFGLVLIIEGIVGAITCNNSMYSDGKCGNPPQCPAKETARVAAVAIESILAIIGLAEGIVAIWSSVVCTCIVGACCCGCDGPCCCPNLKDQAQTQAQLMTLGQAILMQQPFVVAINGQPTGAASAHQQQQQTIIMHNQSMQQRSNTSTRPTYVNVQADANDQGPYEGLNRGIDHGDNQKTLQYEEIGHNCGAGNA